jgi:hypothetical protein
VSIFFSVELIEFDLKNYIFYTIYISYFLMGAPTVGIWISAKVNSQILLFTGFGFLDSFVWILFLNLLSSFYGRPTNLIKEFCCQWYSTLKSEIEKTRKGFFWIIWPTCGYKPEHIQSPNCKAHRFHWDFLLNEKMFDMCCWWKKAQIKEEKLQRSWEPRGGEGYHCF